MPVDRPLDIWDPDRKGKAMTFDRTNPGFQPAANGGAWSWWRDMILAARWRGW
jgi:hypothetical protein